MREIINYMLEANASLLLFLAFYKIALGKETNFSALRKYLLVALLFSVLFPLIHIQRPAAVIPSVSELIPANWLPEVIVRSQSGGGGSAPEASYGVWEYLSVAYTAGVVFFVLLLIIQFIRVSKVILKSSSYKLGSFKVAESFEQVPSFSFFNFIYIGRCDHLSDVEKSQVIRHESIHAKQLHSIDILLVTVIGIVFWFNPFIRTYRRLFVQLHEFEADARSVDDSEVDVYCHLLAKVALQSANFNLASHFNQSLTLKRIQMMRTIKRRFPPWKMVAAAGVVALAFAGVACQDQIIEEVDQIKENSSMALDIPGEIQQKYEFIKKSVAGEVLLLEATEKGASIAENLKKKLNEQNVPLDPDDMTEVQVVKHDQSGRTFLIVQLQKSLKASMTSDVGPDGEPVFLVVEHAPEFPGGYDALREFIGANLKYPASAVAAKLEGTVYIAFIINKDGSVSDASVLKGVDPSMDQEALRVVKMFPKWKPGKQNGKDVRVKFNIPIKYGL